MIYNKKHTTEEAIRLSDNQSIHTKICCCFLRRKVLQADCIPLPNTVSLQHIYKGEVNTPEDFLNFQVILLEILMLTLNSS